MGKKSSGKHYVSKGEVPTVSKKNKMNNRGVTGYSNSMDRLVNVIKAYREGRPISNETLLAMGPRSSAEENRYRELGGVVRKEKKNRK